MSDAALLDMLAAAKAAIRFVDGLDWEAFAKDEIRQAAVVHKLTILGEAAKRVPPPVRERYPGVPWRAAAGLRDRLVHEYDQIVFETVWQVVQHDLPALVAALESLGEEGGE